MDSKPLLLLDVDGVLFPFCGVHLPDGCDWVVFDDVVTPDGRTFEHLRCCFDPGQVERLRVLAEAFELVWATTWEQVANDRLSELFSLPELPVIAFYDAPPGRITYHLSDILSGIATTKLGPVDMWVGERPLAWVDDQLHFDARAWAERRSADGAPTLLVRTDPRRGLTNAQTDELLAFAASLSPSQ